MNKTLTILFTILLATPAIASDPCGMVPPIYTGNQSPIARKGLQQTYVFYKDGVETFVIRPGYTGNVDNFGMLIPFPSPPALRKVPDNVFSQVAAAVDPPEVVVDLRMMLMENAAMDMEDANDDGLAFDKRAAIDEVRVLKQEAVGMYEVAVLEAGSSKALARWMKQNGYQYPDGMDTVCDEYVESGWCFVAVKTKVGQKKGADPAAGQKQTNVDLPAGSSFDGHVQGMGFRFKTDELVVPMRLSSFNEGDTRNVVYLLTDSPKKIRAIPEEYVQRQISGKQLIDNMTQPLPLRIIGGTEKDLTEWHRKSLPEQRKPGPKNGVAKLLFAADIHAVESGELSLAHEEDEKELLRIGEHFGLRGTKFDDAIAASVKEKSDAATEAALADLESMTMTVVDGDFPREVLSAQNLKFVEYHMPARRNTNESYDPKTNSPGAKKEGVLKLGTLDWSHLDNRALANKQPAHRADRARQRPGRVALLFALGLGLIGCVFIFRYRKT